MLDTNSNVERLRQLFPEVVRDGEVDFDGLRELVCGEEDDRTNRFGLHWNGKRRARQSAQTPPIGTLRPCPEESVDWDSTGNLFIEGENLEVLKLLQNAYYRQVKLIYIDPPYNTGHEFVYSDSFQENLENYLRDSGQTDQAGYRTSANSDTSGRYHTNWLNMIYPRLVLARNLLRDDGAIFVSIDDNECHHLRLVCDEVFGPENFKATIVWQKRYTRSNNTADFTSVVEYMHVYGRSDQFSVNLLPRTEEADARYANPDGDDRGPWKGASFLNPATPQQRPKLCYAIQNPNTKQVTQPSTNAWRRSKTEFDKLAREGRLYWGADGQQPVPSVKMFLAEARGLTPTNFWSHEYAGCTDDGTNELKQLFGQRLFDNPKPVQLMKRVLEHASDDDSLVLDFFAGSCTLPQAVMEMNLVDGGKRRFIAIQLPEVCQSTSLASKAGYTNIAGIGRERLRRFIRHARSHTVDSEFDLGYRSFRLSSSNLHGWQTDPSHLEVMLNESVDQVKKDRSEMDVIFELLLRDGIELTANIACHAEHGARLWSVNQGLLMICLDNPLHIAIADRILQRQAQQTQSIERVIFRDAGFVDDALKASVTGTLTHFGIEVSCI